MDKLKNGYYSIIIIGDAYSYAKPYETCISYYDRNIEDAQIFSFSYPQYYTRQEIHVDNTDLVTSVNLRKKNIKISCQFSDADQFLSKVAAADLCKPNLAFFLKNIRPYQ